MNLKLPERWGTCLPPLGVLPLTSWADSKSLSLLGLHFQIQVLFANMIYLLTSSRCSVLGVGGVTLSLWDTHSLTPLPGRAATWGACSLCLDTIRGRKVPAGQGRPFNPGAALRNVLLSQGWWQLRSCCPFQIWTRVLSFLIPYVNIISSSGWPSNNLAKALKPLMCVQSVYSHPWLCLSIYGLLDFPTYPECSMYPVEPSF